MSGKNYNGSNFLFAHYRTETGAACLLRPEESFGIILDLLRGIEMK